MPLDHTPDTWLELDDFDDSDTVEDELEALQRAVAQARQHSWTDPDPIEPELENFLAALSGSHAAIREGNEEFRFVAEDTMPRRHNSWREVLEDVS